MGRQPMKMTPTVFRKQRPWATTPPPIEPERAPRWFFPCVVAIAAILTSIALWRLWFS